MFCFCISTLNFSFFSQNTPHYYSMKKLFFKNNTSPVAKFQQELLETCCGYSTQRSGFIVYETFFQHKLQFLNDYWLTGPAKLIHETSNSAVYTGVEFSCIILSYIPPRGCLAGGLTKRQEMSVEFGSYCRAGLRQYIPHRAHR